MSTPDYEGFVRHVDEWKQKGIPYGVRELIDLAVNKYSTPLPESVFKNMKKVTIIKAFGCIPVCDYGEKVCCIICAKRQDCDDYCTDSNMCGFTIKEE